MELLQSCILAIDSISHQNKIGNQVENWVTPISLMRPCCGQHAYNGVATYTEPFVFPGGTVPQEALVRF
jgi:hypothetical protein